MSVRSPDRKAYRLDVHRGISRSHRDAEQVRAVILQLVGEGFSYEAVGASVGVSGTTCRNIATGRSQQIKRTAAERLEGLSRAGVIAATPPFGVVPIVGTRRRIEALMSLGWRIGDISDRAGISLYGHYENASGVARSTHDAVAAVYEQLWQTPGPSSITRQRARAAGWAPPMAWDDIDDPQAEPCVGAEGQRRDAIVEDVEWLLSTAHGLQAAIERLGLKQQSLERALLRAGRSDLIGRLKRADREAS